MSELAMPTTFEGVKTSPNLTLSLNRAVEQARELHQRVVSIEHLLLALTDDPDATGSLEACGVDLARLKTDIATFVTKSASGGHGEASGEPASSPELRHMLDQAVEAAREAKRQEINSFIVLAAIVGQERSQAAAILQAHGFTFNEAIEALKPRAPRVEAAAETKSATAQPRRPAPRVADAAPSASQVAEAMAQSADSLPPLPTAASRPPRPAAEKTVKSTPEAVAPATPPPSAPMARAEGGARPPIQSVDDIMASVRDRMGAPRPPASGAPAPPANAQASTSAPSTASPPPRPQTRVLQRPSQSPMPQRRPTNPGEGAGAEIFDLGAPLPEDRIVPPVRAPGRPEGVGSAESVSLRRREPTLGFPPPPPPLNAPAPGAVAQRAPSPVPMRPSSPASAGPAQPLGRPSPVAASAAPAPLPPPAPPGMAGAPGGQRAPAPQRPSGHPAASVPTSVAGGAGSPAAAGDRRHSLDAVNPGQLAEAIPRVMRAWVPERVEVRIARRSIDGLAIAIEGRGVPVRHDVVITSAMSVRLKAPDGGFAIDTISPETQWIENRPGLISGDDFASWRWTVRPMRSGRRRLHLVVSARTAGPDGSTAETALPDQIIEIKIRTNLALAAKRWSGWIAAAVVGGALGKFGEGALELFRKISGL